MVFSVSEIRVATSSALAFSAIVVSWTQNSSVPMDPCRENVSPCYL